MKKNESKTKERKWKEGKNENENQFENVELNFYFVKKGIYFARTVLAL